MLKRAITVAGVLLCSAALLAGAFFAQGPGGGAPAVQLASPGVTFERILNAGKEPQNWLTYSGSLMSQRYSLLTQVTPANAKELELKWVFQSRSLEKHEVTPLVVNGVMYTVQSPNDVVALDAATGKMLWTYLYKPDPAAKNC
jgi:glucose dehydrogenase